MGGNTDLKGAVIASEAEASKNKLSTETLTYEDIENKAEYSAESSGISYNSQANLEEGAVAGLAPNVGAGAEGEADSATKSAIAEGTVEVRSDKDKDLGGLSRDTENALNKLEQIFDKDEVKEKQELANLFSELAFKEIGDLAAKHDKEILEKHKQIEEKGKQAEQLRKEGKNQEALQLEKEIVELANQANEQYKEWKDGGTNKTILHALVGAITAQLGGSNIASGALGAGLSEKLQGQLQDLSPEMRIWASAIIGMATDKITGNKTNTGAQAAIDGTKYNDLREAEIIAAILAAQNANKEVIETATESTNKGGGKQNEEIVEKVTEGKEETPKPKEPTNNGYQDQQSQEMKPEPPKTPGQIEGNIIKENNEYYEIQGGEKVKVPAEEVEGNKRYYVEGQGWYEIKNGVDTYVETDRVIDGKHWTIDEQGKDKYVGEVSEGFNKLSKEEQEIALKYNSATAIADKIEYVGQFLGESWKERIEGYWKNQYELFIMSGTTPELAKAGADLATGELMTPVIGSLSKGNAIASDLGVLEGKLNNVSKGNVGGKVVPNLQASDKMRQMTNLHPNYDCSEIADDLYRAAGNKGEIIKITPTQKYSDLNVVENGKTTVFEYHEVYSDGKYVFDPRYNNNPILKDDYIKAINDLNGGKINIEIIK